MNQLGQPLSDVYNILLYSPLLNDSTEPVILALRVNLSIGMPISS